MAYNLDSRVFEFKDIRSIFGGFVSGKVHGKPITEDFVKFVKLQVGSDD